MNRRRIIFIVLGWLCICLNSIGWLAVIAMPNNKYQPNGTPEIAGFNFWFVIGFVLLFAARKEKRKMERKKGQQILDNFFVEK